MYRRGRRYGSGDQNPLWEKAVGAGCYLLLGAIVSSYQVEALSGLITIFMLLGFLYWFFIARQKHLFNEFLRYHILQALILNISIAAMIWLFLEALGLFATLPLFNELIVQIYKLIFSPLPILGLANLSIKTFVILITALILAFDTFRGRFSEIPWLSDGVRNWV